MILFLGADVPSNRIILQDMGVNDFGVSYWRLRQRGLPKTKPYLFEGRFQDEVNIHLDLGSDKSKTLESDELHSYLAEALTFVENNADRITTCINHPDLPVEALCELLSPSKIITVWEPKTGLQSLRKLSEQHQHIGIPGIAVNDSIVGTLRGLRGSVLHAIACAKPDSLTSVRFETASTLSWLSPMMRGETIVWDGYRILRYPKKIKDQARSRYKAIIEKAGLDYRKVLDDDAVEITKLAVWSYVKLGEQMDKKNRPTHLRLVPDLPKDPFIADNREDLDIPRGAENHPAYADNKGVEIRKPGALIPQREPHEMSVIPVMGFTNKTLKEVDKDGLETEREVLHVGTSAVAIRLCDSCVLSDNCPMYRPEASCAFNFPISFETMDQVRSMMTGLLEMQAARIVFTRYAEELNGGMPDPNLSQEIDRFFKLVEKQKSIESDSSYTKISIEQRGTSPGVLSRIFGPKPQQIERPMTPQESDAFLADVIEAEIVED